MTGLAIAFLQLLPAEGSAHAMSASADHSSSCMELTGHRGIVPPVAAYQVWNDGRSLQ